MSTSFLVAKEGAVLFNRDIRPLLSNKCFHCHGPNKDYREKNLRLDIPEGDDGALALRKDESSGERYYIIKAGDPLQSELWRRISSSDKDLVMPPADSHKHAVTEREKALFKQWIIEGGAYEDYWAFKKPIKANVISVKDGKWGAGAIDNQVLAHLEAKGLTPSAQADKRTLLRRVTFDITGLPPTLGEINAFLNDTSSTAYETVVDRLLNDKAYGEHMTRYWADLVRLSDTNGMHKDFHREFSPYRDWLIRSFNDNMPYDEFIKYQLAGDLYTSPTRDQLVASGFNRLHIIIDRGTALPEESLHKNVVDRVSAFGTTFLGLTVQCAQCHDHKYDPITQKDYFQLYAFFNNFSGKPETVELPPPRGLQPPFINFTTPAQEEALLQFDNEIAKLKKSLKESKKSEALKHTHKTLTKTLKDIQKKKTAYLQKIPGAMHMQEMVPPRQTTMLGGGAYDAPGEPVERNTPQFLLPMKEKTGIYSRMDLAQWLVDRDHPLTARVAVNRFWQQFFGVGLVKTSEDFGAQGEWPSHIALLDDLAVGFMVSNWNVKKLVQKIVLSKTYKQSSDAESSAYIKDPENRLLARGSRYRMDAEMIRDQLLQLSGKLNKTMYGKSVKPPQPDGLWKMVAMGGSVQAYVPDTGDNIYRRSLYTYSKRAIGPPAMTIMNAPARETCITRRERTNTPLQALLMMNETEYFKAAKACAVLTLKTIKGREDRLIHTYEKITSHLPNKKRLALMSETLDDFVEAYSNDKAMIDALTPELDKTTHTARVELAAWTMITHSIINLELAKVKR